ncbi:uncharacterized protein LOC120846405 [Ixodes scapularis]|uniref:uncharacterized protein LOC120846405 n=1 Tax=Ixodes scapularis TaxID=6945 RepID=UPI001A9FA61F|nr:uncharacterized protein LOC120846405 [Ixodes scapularis]
MQINIDKTKIMTFTNRRSSFQYDDKVIDSKLDKVSTYKYLGVHLTSNLSWNTHLDYILRRANQSLGFLRRHLYMATAETKLLAYSTLIRPKLKYAAIIWNPHQKYLNNNLESLQNRATRFILKTYSPISVSQFKSSLGLLTLHQRRYLARSSHFHKLYHSSSDFRQNNILPPARISPRHDHCYKVHIPFARTNLFKYSPFVQAATEWNELASEIAMVTDHDTFMLLLRESLG